MKNSKNLKNITDISVILPTKNTLNYTLMAYRSLRKYYPDNEIIILDDGSTDGTEDWLFGCVNENGGKLQGQIDLDDNLRAWRNTTGNILGHTVTYNMGIKMAKGPLVSIFHSDMICHRGYLENMLKNWKPKHVISATRVEPEGIYPPGKEKILKPFGIEFYEFKREEFEKFCDNEMIVNEGKTTPGIFAPWLISKEEYLSTGGMDEKSFAPYPEEDGDWFLRLALGGFTLTQSWDSFCYHFISKGHRSWAKNGVGKDDNMFAFYQNRARRNYLRKWHKWMQYDENRHPIGHKVFDVAFVIRDFTDVNFLHFVEPWANKVYVNPEGWSVAEEYIKKEQLTTKLNLSDRVVKHTGPSTPLGSDIVLEFSQKDFMANANENAGIISTLTDILSDGVEDNSEFEYGIFKLKTKTIKDLASTLIKV